MLASVDGGSLIALRAVGGVAGLVILYLAARRYSRRQISRRTLILTGLIAAGLILLAIQPNVFDPVFNLVRLNHKGGGQRLIGALLIANLVFFFMLFRTTTTSDANALAIRHLVEALSVATFDLKQGEELGAGDAIIVVMPAYNEAENIGAVITDMPEEVDGRPVVTVVISDASDDGTAEVARAAGALVAELPIRRGQGLALRVGYEIALRLHGSIVVSMDADGQHIPAELPVIVEPILAGRAEMVNGSRLLGEFQRESIVRYAGVHFFSWLVTLMTGSHVTDVSNGFRATRMDSLRRLRLDQDQFWASELLLEGMRHRMMIVEVPITIRARAKGNSKKPKNAKYAWNFTKAIMRTWLR